MFQATTTDMMTTSTRLWRLLTTQTRIVILSNQNLPDTTRMCCSDALTRCRQGFCTEDNSNWHPSLGWRLQTCQNLADHATTSIPWVKYNLYIYVFFWLWVWLMKYIISFSSINLTIINILNMLLLPVLYFDDKFSL